MNCNILSQKEIMDLILWRHAEAEEGVHDLSRQLTAKGEKQATKWRPFCVHGLPHGTRILVSPRYTHPANRTGAHQRFRH
ncbi:MAG: hypothetical protein WDM70_03785 [Nitrosomonadales bacterium]